MIHLSADGVSTITKYIIVFPISAWLVDTNRTTKLSHMNIYIYVSIIGIIEDIVFPYNLEQQHRFIRHVRVWILTIFSCRMG